MMVVYAETNFILELAYLQEQHASCEKILALAESGQVRLVLPAYSFAEAQTSFLARREQRNLAHNAFTQPVREISRSAPYQFSAEAVAGMIKVLLRTISDEEEARLETLLSRLRSLAEVAPMDASVVDMASDLEQRFDLAHQDAVICASVIQHLDQTRPAASCFLNRNANDFDTHDVKRALRRHGCRLITRFDQGLGYVLSLE